VQQHRALSFQKGKTLSNSSLQLFEYSGHQVRTVLLNGQPGFVAADLCKILDIKNSRDALASLDLDEKGVATIDTPGGQQQMRVVNEPGMYSLVLRSRKKEAKKFKRWVTHEVLPQIRATGSYSAPKTLEQRSLEVIGELTQVVQDQQLELEEARPKVAAWDSIVSSAGSWSYNDAAKVLCEDGEIEIGEKRLVRQLVDWGYFYRDHKGRPKVYQPYIKQGLFTVKARTYTDQATGEVKESSAPQVRITGKGLGVIRDRLLANNATTKELF